MLFLATVEAGIHSRHPEEPAGTHGEVTRGHRELDRAGNAHAGAQAHAKDGSQEG